MITVTLTRPNANRPFLTTVAEKSSIAVAAAMRAYSEQAGSHHTAELVEKIGERCWKLQPGRQIERGSLSLDRPIIIEAIE